jgi:hypothetical protein
MMVLQIVQGRERKRILTYLTAEELDRMRGVPPQAVVAVLGPDDSLQVNALFREFLHETIATTAPLDPALQSFATTQEDGRLVYVDARVPEDVHPVPEEDVIGWFQIRGGRIVAGSYLPNPHHKVQNGYGLTAVLGEMRQAMVQTLLAREGS